MLNSAPESRNRRIRISRLLLIIALVLVLLVVAVAGLAAFSTSQAEMQSRQALLASAYVVALDGDDASPGSAEAPFRTINHGLSVLQPGDTLVVRAGLYREELRDTIPSGDSWERPVTLRAMPGEEVIIMPDAGARRVIEFAGDSHHIIVDGFILDGTNTTYEVIKLAGNEDPDEPSPHHIRIMNNEIRNAGAAQSSNGEYRYFSAGILATGNSNYIEYLHNTVHSNGVTDFDHGIYHTSSYSLIEGNVIYNNKGSGIKIGWGQDAVDNIVRGNLIYDNNTAEGADGQKGQGRGIGIYAGSGTLVYNNVIRGAHHSAIDATYGGNNAQIFNNTIYATDGWGIVVGLGSSEAETASNTVVRNNIVYQMGERPAIADLRGINTIIERNLTYGANPHIDKDADSNAQIRDNLRDVDPLTDDRLSLRPGSPAIDAGLVLDEVATDFNGNSRPQGGQHDIGAYEYVPRFFLFEWLGIGA